MASTAFEKFERFDPDSSFIKWVLSIAHYKSLQFFEKQKRDPHIFSDPLVQTRLERAYTELSSEVPVVTATTSLRLDDIYISENTNLAYIPEPGSLALLGLGSLMMLRRRRKDA